MLFLMTNNFLCKDILYNKYHAIQSSYKKNKYFFNLMIISEKIILHGRK